MSADNPGSFNDFLATQPNMLVHSPDTQIDLYTEAVSEFRLSITEVSITEVSE